MAKMVRFSRRISPLSRCLPPALLAATAIAVSCALLWPPPASAGGTGSVGLLTPNGSGAPTNDGDYVSASVANGGMNSPFHFFVEVPASLSRLVVELFDADIGIGGTAEGLAQRDRARNGFDTAASYTLFDPSGTQRFTFFNAGNVTTPANSDNLWLSLYDIKSGGNDANVLDQFTTAAYNNQNGSVNWSTNWTETNDNGSPTTGLILITGGQLSISDNADGNPSTIQRSANLTAAGFVNAILSFNFTTSASTVATDVMEVDVSANGGATWTTLDTFTGPFTTAQTRAYNITSSIATNTSIRFIRNTGYNGHTFLVDNVQIKNDSLPAGHWEVRVDQTSTVTAGTAINALGIRAHDGTSGSGGTELNVYADSLIDIGVNPPNTAGGTNTRSYVFYPYMTSGCTFFENDFDYDSDQGNTGSMTFKSPAPSLSPGPTNPFTQTLASAALSQNNVWTRNSITGFANDGEQINYGTWEADLSITSYDPGGTLANQNGNYANFYTANFNAAANPPAANPTANGFRIYFANDAGTVPAKPHLEQIAGFVSGSQPPAVGQPTVMTVNVRVINPAAQAITFSATNLVTANVPGGTVIYNGNAVVTQGTIVSQPAVGGSGNITWNPGTVAAGSLASPTIAFLAYQVKVIPTAAGQRNPLTGTPASGNGTRATYVDETGNTTQARATYTHGPLCELAITQAVITPVVVSGLRARRGERGGVLVEWDTSSEVGTIGFDLLRWEPREGRYVQANRTLLPALLNAAQGGHYRFLDESARDAGAQRFIVVEHVALPSRVEERSYGPFEVELAAPGAADELQGSRRLELPALPDSGFDRTPWLPTAPTRSGAPGAVSAAATTTSGPAGTAAGGDREAGAEDTLSAAAIVQGDALGIGVRDPGIYFLAATDIAARLGFPLPIVQALLAGGALSISNRGLDVAWLAADNPQGMLFYGEAANSIYTTDNVYWLRPGIGTRMRIIPGKPPAPAAAASFRDTGHTEQETFAATVIATDPNSDYWFWDFLIAGDPTSGSKSFQLNATGVAAAAASSAHLQVNLFGATASGVAGEHHAMVTLNGTPIGEDTWTGVSAHAVQLDFSQSLLHEGANTVAIQAVLGPGVPYSIFYLAGFDVTYQRLFQAVGDALLVRGDANPVITVSGFADSRVAAFDVTDPRHPALDAAVTIGKAPAGSGFAISFAPAAAGSPYQTVSLAGAKAPVWLRTPNPVSLRAASKGGDYLVVTTHDLLGAAQELATYRAGQGLKATVVDIQDVYDQFSDGLTDPRALQSFLSFAHGGWRIAPRFVVLAGQGTLDYRNNLGFGGNLLPPLMAATSYGLFASDNLFVDPLGGDGVLQAAIGRLPVATVGDLHALVQKIRLYESGAPAAWSGRALLVADSADGIASFAADSDQIASNLPSGYSAQRIYVDQLGPGAARSALQAGLGGGAGLVNYVGHGGLDRLSAAGLLVSSDAAGLGNGPRLPVMSALTCTINRFELPGFQALGAALVQQPGGGAAAVWRPRAFPPTTPRSCSASASTSSSAAPRLLDCASARSSRTPCGTSRPPAARATCWSSTSCSATPAC